jgi:hypothetical protein
MTTQHREHPTRREIQRDEDIVAGGLLRGLLAIVIAALDRLLLHGARIDVHALHDTLAAHLRSSRRHCRRLNDRRIVRRSGRRAVADGVPEVARPFARNGAYLGAFPTLDALAARMLGLNAVTDGRLDRLDLVGVALDLHLEGVVWTVDIAGEIHAFRPRPHGPIESPPG